MITVLSIPMHIRVLATGIPVAFQWIINGLVT